MAAKSWDLEIRGNDELLVALEKSTGNAEEAINRSLKNFGGEFAKSKIIEGIPISKGRLRQGKQHAKQSNPLKVEFQNLGFKVRPKPKFNYIKYPDLGIGTSRKNKAQEFMYKGLENSVKSINEDLIKEVNKSILGG